VSKEPVVGLIPKQTEWASISMDTTLDYHRKGIWEHTSRVISSRGHHRRIGASDGTIILHFHEVLY